MVSQQVFWSVRQNDKRTHKICQGNKNEILSFAPYVKSEINMMENSTFIQNSYLYFSTQKRNLTLKYI